MERFEELPDFDGNIDLSTLDSYAADFAADSALATLDPTVFFYQLASDLFYLVFISNFPVVQSWILDCQFGFDFINWI